MEALFGGSDTYRRVRTAVDIDPWATHFWYNNFETQFQFEDHRATRVGHQLRVANVVLPVAHCRRLQ